MKRFIGIFLLLVVVAGVVASAVVSSTATSEEKMDYAKFELESLMNILDINGTIYNGQTDVYQNVISEDFFHHTVHKVGASNPLFKGVDVFSVQVLNDDVDLVLHPEYFYSVVLMDILQNGELQAFNEDALQSTVTSNTTKTVEKTYSAIAENWSDSLGSNSLTNFMNADLSKLTDLQIEQLGNDLIETNRKSFGYTNTVSNLNLLSYFVDVGEVLVDAIEKINTLQAVAFYNAKTIEILDDIYYNTSNSNLKKAIRDIKNIYEDIDSPEELQNKLSEANVTATMYTVQRLTYVTAKFVVTSLAEGVLKVGLIVWDIGFSLANAVFSLSDKSTCYMTIDAAVLIENELRACMSRYRSDYLSNRTVENAERCREAYRLTLANQYYATNLVQKLGYIIAGDGSLSGSFKSLFGNDDYQVFVDNCENTRSIIWSRYYSFTEVTQRFYESLYGVDFEHSTSTPIILVSSVYFEHSSYTLLTNETIQNKATAYPKNASGRSISYSSSDPSVATVNSIGEITAVSEGKAIITATSTNDISTTCEITVLPFKASIVNGTYQIDGYVGSGGDVVIPDTIRGIPVTSIGYKAFYECKTITSVSIPKSVNDITGDYAFLYCFNLTDVYYRGDIADWCAVKFSHNIDSSPMYYRKNLYINGNLVEGEIVIPDGVKCISPGAFYNCEKITSVVIPDSVESIGDSAFTHCTSLKKIVIPDSVKNIGYSAFWGCENLTSLTLFEGMISIGGCAFSGCTKLEVVTLADTLTNIGGSAFSFCESLTNIKIPDKVTCIERETFTGCTSLISVDLPKNLKTISDYAFAFCHNLESLEIPDGVTSIGGGAFWSCGFKCITIPDGVTRIYDQTFDECGRLESVTLPKNLENISGFSNCISLKSITFPDSLTCISVYAFHGCTNLTDIKLPDGLSKILAQAFENCTSLTSITFPESITYIGEDAFEGCTKLAEINIPDVDVEIYCSAFNDTSYYNDESHWDNEALYIGKHLIITKPSFSDKNAIKSDTITIASCAFRDCTTLTSVTVPGDVMMSDDTFSNHRNIDNQNLKSVYISNGVSKISNSCFYDCVGLKTLVIPVSVTYVEVAAFYDNANLTDVYYEGTREQWDAITIERNNDNLLNANIHFSHKHAFDMWSVMNVPTSVDGGSKFHTCSECKVAEKVEIPATGFEFISGVSIDFAYNVISGFEVGSTSFDNYTTLVNDNYVWNYETLDGRLGTGSKAILKDDDSVIGEYTVTIFGDVNGDGWYDGTDSIIVSCLANGLLSKDDVSPAFYTAADCNHDGVIDSFDVALLEQAGLLLANVDQSKSNEELATDEAFIEYLDLIDQTPDEDVVEDEVIETPEEEPEEFDLIEFIITIIKKFFELLILNLPIK